MAPQRGWFGRPVRPPDPRRQGSSRSVFFNAIWIYLAAAVLVLGMVTRELGMTLLGALVLITAASGYLWNRYALEGVILKQSLNGDRALPGDELTLTLTVTNRKPLPLPWLAIDLELSDGLTILDRATTPSGASGRQMLRIATGLRAYERVTWRIRFACPRRGYHAIGPATLRSGDLFGFFSKRVQVPEQRHVTVYPRVVELGELTLPSREPLGEIRAQRNLLTDPSRVVGVRDYRPDDPFRMIHWKATARQGQLQVRIAEPMTALRLGIFLNLDTFDHYWEGLDLILAERLIVAAASLAAWADRAKYAVGIYANGLLAGSDQSLRVPPGRGVEQLPRVLEGLAKVSPFSTLPVQKVLATELPRFPYGSTLAVVTSRMTEPLTALLLQVLDLHHQAVLVPLGDCQVPSLPGLIVLRLDEDNLDLALTDEATAA